MTDFDHQLLDAYLDGTLSDGEFVELETLLKESADARRRLRLLATIDEGLAEFEQGTISNQSVEKNSPDRSALTFLPWGIAVAACIALAINTMDFTQKDGGPENSGGDLKALLVDEAAAVFADGRGPKGGVRFGTGDYELIEGAVHLRFSNGADLVMSAPVEFSVEDAYHINVAHGNVRAIVPPPARGFTITSPGIDYEDIGTEFGVMVDRNSGASELHVFDGQVNVREPGSSKLLQPAYVGDSFRYDGTDLKKASAPDENAFLTPGAIGFLRWEKWQKKFLNTPGLVGFFAFSDGGNVIKNRVPGDLMSDGEIRGARWVTGRWPEKQALLFDRDDDFVEFDLPGEFPELSIAVWMKVDRFDHELSAILNSNQWEAGDIHWQISRTGLPWVGLNDHGINRQSVGNPISAGQWSHVVMVMSKSQNRAEVFVNGLLVNRGELSGEFTSVTPGRCRLGNWLKDPEWPHAPVRALRGRIDELAVWNRPLSEKEIKEIMKVGQPAPLWSTAPITNAQLNR